MTFYEAVGNRIRQVRMQAGWNQGQLAEAIRIGGPALSRFENGKPVSLDVLRRICTVLNVPLSQLLDVEASTPEPAPQKRAPKVPPKPVTTRKADERFLNGWRELSPRHRKFVIYVIEDVPPELFGVASKKRRRK